MAVVTRDERIANAVENGLPVDDFAGDFVINDRRGQPKPEKPERHGKIAGFVPSRDRVLVKRLAPIKDLGSGIISADIGIELAERGVVVAVGPCEYGALPIGSIADFSKYGAQEKRFDDDEGPNTYAIVWIDDVTGWHDAGN